MDINGGGAPALHLGVTPPRPPAPPLRCTAGHFRGGLADGVERGGRRWSDRRSPWRLLRSCSAASCGARTVRCSSSRTIPYTARRKCGFVQGVRPLTWFGERLDRVGGDLFAENVSTSALGLKICDDEDPIAVMADGECGSLRELTLHNAPSTAGNHRPVYQVSCDGGPTPGVEKRVMPGSGPNRRRPTCWANALLPGLSGELAEAPGPPAWDRRWPFGAAAAQTSTRLRDGIGAACTAALKGRALNRDPRLVRP